MNDQTDSQLLRAYATDRTDAAFTELVRRHVDFVYSAAMRMVRDSHLAQDVTQSVFVALAKNAGQLTDRAVLTGWLHRAAQNIAAQSIRTDVRRRAREQEAAAMNQLLSDSGTAVLPVWSEIAPHLDAGLGELTESDRDALLLRYFEHKSAREMAQLLGISNEAAQKRVSRAVERLREYFTKHGVTVGAGGLTAVISANAVQAAPIGLALTISTATAAVGTTFAATTTATTTAATATKAIAMTTFQKTVIGATLAAAIGAGVYEAHEASQLRKQVETFEQRQVSLTEQVRQVAAERDEALERVDALLAREERLNQNASELLSMRAEVSRLRQLAAQATKAEENPRLEAVSILSPTNQDEFEEVKRQRLMMLQRIGLAMRHFMTNNPVGVIVDDSGHVNSEVFSGMQALPLDAFQIMVRDVQHLALVTERHPKIVIVKSTSPVQFDGTYTHFYLLADGSSRAVSLGTPEEQLQDGFLPSDESLRALAEANDPVRKVLLPALEAFAAANGGQKPTHPTQLQPYITTSEQQAVLNKEIERINAAANPAKIRVAEPLR